MGLIKTTLLVVASGAVGALAANYLDEHVSAKIGKLNTAENVKYRDAVKIGYTAAVGGITYGLVSRLV